MNRLPISAILPSAFILSACGILTRSSTDGTYSQSNIRLENMSPTKTQSALISPVSISCNPESIGLTLEEEANCGQHSYAQQLNSLTISRTNTCGLFIGQQDREDSILPSEGNWKFIFHKDKVTIGGDDWDDDICDTSFSRSENNKYGCENVWSATLGRSLYVLTFSPSGFTLKKYVYGDPSGVFNGLCGSMMMTLSTPLSFNSP